MNKASTKACQLMNYYLNNNKSIIKDFRLDYIFLPDGCSKLFIFTHKELSHMYKNISPSDVYQHNSISTKQKSILKRAAKGDKEKYQELLKDCKHFMNTANNKTFQNIEYHLIAYIKNTIIPKTSGNDLVIINTSMKTPKPQQQCHIFKMKDLTALKNALLDFLTEDTDAQSRIKWMLQHKPVSDYKFGKLINMTPSQITKYKNGKLSISNMTITNGEKIDHYYMNFVGKQLIGHDVILPASDINNGFK